MKESDIIYRGMIVDIIGPPMSGLWTLVILWLDLGYDHVVYIESGWGIRALRSAFGATAGRDDFLINVLGQHVYYTVNDLDVLLGFTPVKEATPELLYYYQTQWA